jgi:MinD-like ATPase involved in chromosome partitioning or flagellar assembly
MTQAPQSATTVDRPPGKIVTFYSYKGGTGRSMALANVAWILASNGKRVLVVDWDIEAPGLHRYFAPFLLDHELSTSDGVIDFLGRYADAVVTPPRTEGDNRDDWYLAYADITRLATSLEWKFNANGTLDFIGAGRQSAAYPGRVANFPWQAFFERLGGGTLLDAARERMRAEYDYVLIDSRTGVSDAAGICTIQLPDALFVCFTLNNQSIAGAARIARLVSEKPGKAEMPIYPVPMRVEDAEKDKRDARWKYAKSTFAAFPNGMTLSDRESYWKRMEVRYYPYYAYEELLAVFGDLAGKDGTLLAAMERLTAHVTNGEVTALPPMEDRARLLYRDMYAWQSDRVSGSRDVVGQAEHTLKELPTSNQIAAKRFLLRLVRVGRSDEGGTDGRAKFPERELSGSENLLRAFASGGIIRLEADPSLGEEFIELSDDMLIRRWPTLRQWVEEDRSFLLWRQQLRTYLADWQRTDRDRGALLSGRPLAEAGSFMQSRADDISSAERAYIEASLTAEAEEQKRKETELQQLNAERQRHAEEIARYKSAAPAPMTTTRELAIAPDGSAMGDRRRGCCPHPDRRRGSDELASWRKTGDELPRRWGRRRVARYSCRTRRGSWRRQRRVRPHRQCARVRFDLLARVHDARGALRGARYVRRCGGGLWPRDRVRLDHGWRIPEARHRTQSPEAERSGNRRPQSRPRAAAAQHAGARRARTRVPVPA